jgi:hypothetical protein
MNATHIRVLRASEITHGGEGFVPSRVVLAHVPENFQPLVVWMEVSPGSDRAHLIQGDYFLPSEIEAAHARFVSRMNDSMAREAVPPFGDAVSGLDRQARIVVAAAMTREMDDLPGLRPLRLALQALCPALELVDIDDQGSYDWILRGF